MQYSTAAVGLRMLRDGDGVELTMHCAWQIVQNGCRHQVALDNVHSCTLCEHMFWNPLRYHWSTEDMCFLIVFFFFWKWVVCCYLIGNLKLQHLLRHYYSAACCQSYPGRSMSFLCALRTDPVSSTVHHVSSWCHGRSVGEFEGGNVRAAPKEVVLLMQFLSSTHLVNRFVGC